jgi:hypothetical protein
MSKTMGTQMPAMKKRERKEKEEKKKEKDGPCSLAKVFSKFQNKRDMF